MRNRLWISSTMKAKRNRIEDHQKEDEEGEGGGREEGGGGELRK